ncbi:metallophosphoesterase family protein [Nocardioides campestrisoli]|uniref:metallophosphoesterase family protein n=1 Tax=Nocardioides campestrisoli TaxID=2736757 RepID=UPI00163D9E9E|nr:metallophosphoesterase [Nocardioides campestrisoli]
MGEDGAWSAWAEFATADPADPDLQYVYYGDAQTGLDTTWPRVVAMAEASAPDSIGSVHAGDLVDVGNHDHLWESWFRGMARSAATTNVLAAPGNHEYAGDRLLRSWKAHFEYPANHPDTGTVGALAQRAVGETDAARQYRALFAHWRDLAHETVYFTDYQSVRFVTVNATRDLTFLTPASLPACTTAPGSDCPADRIAEVWVEYQAAWLDHVLTRSPARWNVVTFHQPVLSATAGRDEPLLRRHWLPVFSRHDVDLVQMGHDHAYARGYLNQDRTTEPGVTDGPVFVVSNSGDRHYNLEVPARNVWTANGAAQVLTGARVTTYQVVTVSADRLVYRSYLAETAPGAYTVPAQPLVVGGVFDSFTIHKAADGSKRVVGGGAPPVSGPPPAGPPAAGPPPAATPQRARVGIPRTRLRPGRKALVWVRSSTAGKARVTLRVGRRTTVRTVRVTGAAATKVRLGRLPRGAGKGTRRVRLKVVLTPTDPAVAPARAVRRPRVTRR